MAYTATTATTPINLRALAARPFVAVFHFLIRIAEASSCMQEVTKLNNTSDAALAARGLNRADEVTRIFRGRFYL
jgi:hypothetical protein